MIERWNHTMKGRMWRYFTANTGIKPIEKKDNETEIQDWR